MARTTRTRTKKTTKRSTRKPTARRGTKAARSAAAKKAWRTRKRNAKRGAKKSTSSRRPKSRSTAAKRSAAARKAAKTRKANAAKRSRAAKKAAATRKRNSGKKRKSSTKRKSTKRKGRTAASRRTAAKKAAATRKRNAAKRSRAAKKAAATRKRNGGKRRSSKRRTSKRKSYKRRSTKKGKLGKMFSQKNFTSSIMMGVGIVVTGALGLGLMGAVNNYGTQILSSTGVLGYYSQALSMAGAYAPTLDFLVKMGVAGSVLAFGMNKLFGTKGVASGLGKSAFGTNSAAVYGSTAAALALYGMSEMSKLQPLGAGLIQNLASGDVSAVAGRFKLMGAHNNKQHMAGHLNNKMYGAHNNNMGMSNLVQQNNSPMLLNQGAPNSGSNLFGTRKASRGRLNLF